MEEGDALEVHIKPHFDRFVIAPDSLPGWADERTLNNVAIA